MLLHKQASFIIPDNIILKPFIYCTRWFNR